MKIGIIREDKVPQDDRTPFTPAQCRLLMDAPYHFEVMVQSSGHRCYSDDEYRAAGITVVEDISNADVLMGVKEVPISNLIPGKTYFFFSHTIKKQAHNMPLLQAMLDKQITMVDYEKLVDDQHRRLVAFGKFAGKVGAHNALWTFGRRTGTPDWPRMHELHDYETACNIYAKTALPPVRIVMTGHGKVGSGAYKVLTDMGIREVSPQEFLANHPTNEAIFTQLGSPDYVTRADGTAFSREDFYAHPESYVSTFLPYTKVSDIFINCIYWDIRAPKFFQADDIALPDFKIQVIADVTCDIAPDSSVPTTIRASTIADPVYGIDRRTFQENKPFQADSIDVMAIDNLPNELPRDASLFFGNALIEKIIPELRTPESSNILQRATITRDGLLTPTFSYLEEGLLLLDMKAH